MDEPMASTHRMPVQFAERPLTALEHDLQFADMLRSVNAHLGLFQATERVLLANQLDVVMARAHMSTDRAPGSDAVREHAAFLAAELRLSDVAIERRMAEAWHIVHLLPLSHEASMQGRLSAAHLRVIDRAMTPLFDGDTAQPAVRAEVRARVEAELVALAATCTPPQLRRRAARVVDGVLAAPLDARHAQARDERGVWLDAAPDGMCHLSALLPAVIGAAIMDRLTQGAKGMAAGDTRSFDQFRADAAAALLLAGEVPDDVDACQRITPVITLTIAATELARESGGDPASNDPASSGPAQTSAPRIPASLDGRMLVDAATVRELAVDAPTWERLFVHPVTGVAVTADTYRPTAAQRRWLRLRDVTCRWPGCARSAHRSDADHTHDHAKGGATSTDNLAHLCRRHHMMKHGTRWQVRQLGDGVLEWRSPSGRIIVDVPEPAHPAGLPPPP